MATLAVTNDFSAGTTIVAADMNTNFSDVETFVNSSPGLVQNTLVDAKGDLLAASADNTITRLAVGTNTYVLTADSSEATGIKWTAPTVGTVTSVTGTAPIVSSGGTTPAISVTTNDAQLILNNTIFN
tara:strand:- start:118 stop:501 length:384 start_codon:yes stop_codon:yes gene_type:complete